METQNAPLSTDVEVMVRQILEWQHDLMRLLEDVLKELSKRNSASTSIAAFDGQDADGIEPSKNDDVSRLERHGQRQRWRRPPI